MIQGALFMSRLNKYGAASKELYRQLEDLATRIQLVSITYVSDKGPHTVEGFIQNLYAKSKGEFLLLSDGREIRIDSIDRVERKK